MTILTLEGRLAIHDDGDASDVLWCGGAKVADWAQRLAGKTVTVRYWTSPLKLAPDEMKKAALLTQLGVADADYSHRYSELTGYLWTDEKFTVGGHDMLERLRSDNDKYLLLEAEY